MTVPLSRTSRRAPAGAEAPAWRAAVKPTRRVAARPGTLTALGVTVLAALGWITVTGYGAYRLDGLWSVAAALSGMSVLALSLRGFPALALVPLLTGAATWGLATRRWLPDGGGDVIGLLGFAVGNLAYVVPLLISYAAAITVDARRVARAGVDEAFSGRRWWGEADDHLPELVALEAIPSARFFALPSGACTHLVAAGRRAALILPTVWPAGEYTLTAGGEVLRDGRPSPPAGDDLDRLAQAVRGWQERLAGSGATCRGFLLLYPPRDAAPEEVFIDIPKTGQAEVLKSNDFEDTAAAWLAQDPYHVDIRLMSHLLPR